MSFFVRAAAPLALVLAAERHRVSGPRAGDRRPSAPRRRARADPRAGAGVHGRGQAPVRGVRRRRRSREPERRADRRHGARREGRPALALLRQDRARRAHRPRHGLGRRLHGRRGDPHEQPCRRGGAHHQRTPARRAVPPGAPRRARSRRPTSRWSRSTRRASSRRSSPTRTPRASASGSSRSARRSGSATPSRRACSPRRDAAASA